MTVLSLQSEPVSPFGNLSTEGAGKQIGKPDLDDWAVFIREALQNCWDARNTPSVHVLLDLDVVSNDALMALESQVFAEDAPGVGVRRRLSEAWSGKPLYRLIVADEGTTGLDGPTRADVGSGRFVAFLRNLGQAQERVGGGGTFGFGKAVFYTLSHLRTILVHTRCESPRGKDSRFIGAAWGPGQVHAGRRITGRHWWGVADADGYAQPAFGEAADTLAAAVGFPNRTETGSSIMVLDVDQRGRSLQDLRGLIIEVLLWNFWPKMVARPGLEPPMRFTLRVGGERFPVPHPSGFPPLGAFVRAFEQAESFKGAQPLAVPGFRAVSPVRFKDRRYGVVALERMRVERPVKLHELDEVEVGGILAGSCNHVALMRSPRLVVGYREVEALPQPEWGYAGVCIIDDDHDRLFASAEPPTHDHWNAQLPLEDDQRVVKGVLRNVDRKAREFVTPLEPADPKGIDVSVTALSTHLGELLMRTSAREDAPAGRTAKPRVIVEPPPEPPATPEPPNPSPPGDMKSAASEGAATDPTKRPPKPVGTPTLRPGTPELVEYEGVGALRIPFVVKRGVRAMGFRVHARADIMLDDDKVEQEVPMGAEAPGVLGWFDSVGNRLEAGEAGLEVWGIEHFVGAVVLRVVDDARSQPRLIPESLVEPTVEVGE